jgi:alanine racemase
LKSNAYGHGLVEVAKVMNEVIPEFLVVDSYYEAMILRNEGIKSKILIIGFSYLENILSNSMENIAFMITDLSWLFELSAKLQVTTRFHLKIDTGMNRQGIEMEDLPKAIDFIKSNKNIVLEGICSHLACADEYDQNFTNRQIKKWNSIVAQMKGEFPDLKYWHVGASSSLYYAKKIDANVMRLGLDLYGVNADVKMNLDLKPVMQVDTIITSIREVKKGEKIGYGGSFEVNKNMIVATIPFGYFEGMDRRLSNKGWVKIGDKFCPIVGRVSMNISSIDVSEVKDVKVGDKVVVISANKNDKNSIENMAKMCETIPYEIMVHVERMLRREVK